jgi:hypothetical protein
MYLFGSWLVESLWLYYILLWVPSWACVMLLPWFHPHNVYVICAHFAWWCVSKATSCELWRDYYNSQSADFGASQVVSEPRFCRYPRVRSACRITLPMVVVQSCVKTSLLKMRWIVLSRSAFYSLPMCFSPLTFANFESSLLPTSLSIRFPRGWTISCLYPNRFVLREFIIISMCKSPLLVVSERNLLLVVSTSSTRWRFDSLANSSPYSSVDLGARSLVGGVDCTGPEKPPF